MAGILRLSNTGTGNGQSTITSAASTDTTYTLPSGGGTFVTTGSTESLTVPFALGSASAPSVTFVGDTNTGLYSPGADQVAISTGGSGRLFIDSSGRISLGAASTTHDFDILKTSSGATTSARIGSTAASGVNNATLILNSGGTGNSTLRFDYESATNYASISSASSSQNLIFGTGGNERMRLDSSGRLGIGTSVPGSGNRLHIADTSKTSTDRTGIKLQTTDALAANTGLPLVWSGNIGNISDYTWASITGRKENATSGDAAGYLQFATGSSGGAVEEKVRIDSAGRVGIGATTVGDLLHLRAATTPHLRIDHTTTSSFGAVQFYEDGTQQASIGALGSTSGGTGGGNALQIWNFLNAPTVFATNNTERGRWDANGRFLVGTSSYSFAATAVLQGNSSSSTGDAVLRMNRGGTPGANADIGLITFSDNAGNVGAEIRATNDTGSSWGSGDSPGRLVFSTTADGASSPTEHVRINQAGALKVSTNGTYGNPSSALNEFYQTTNTGAINGRCINASFTDSVLTLDADRNTTNNTYYFARFSVTGVAYRFQVADSGNVTNTNNSYGAISDLKFKENIADAASQWDDLKALRVRKYNFKEETGQSTHTQIGLIAQEAELVSPGLVSESPDRDAEGNDLGTVTKSVNYSVLYMKAVKALQEAMERIETLEASNADLLARVSALESA